ncbi:hypothetical protein F4859DRAFT_475550 [Xylaria cf. heliscus]|nr:hypothetical protein F4859DRAFT_475550 [Xylaria cf. heliscus]
MGSTRRGEDYLDLSIEFDPRRVSIGFRNELQASQYKDLICHLQFTVVMRLDPQIHGRFVSVRLPSRVIQIQASTTCDGFYLCTRDADFAKQWKDALMLWKFRRGSTFDLYLERSIRNEDLNRKLHINERPRQAQDIGTAVASDHYRREPGPAPPSYGIRR